MKRDTQPQTFYLNFSEQFELDKGNLVYDVAIQAKVLVQNPVAGADSDWDYSGYTEVLELKYDVEEIAWFDPDEDCMTVTVAEVEKLYGAEKYDELLEGLGKKMYNRVLTEVDDNLKAV